MEETGLQKVVSEILGKVKETNDAIADYQALYFLYKQRKAGYEQDQKAALRAGDQQAYAEAVKNAAEQQILIEFAEKEYRDKYTHPAINDSEIARLSARLRYEIDAAYREKAKQMIPLLEEVDKISREAENLVKMFRELQGAMAKAAKKNGSVFSYENMSCCFSPYLQNRIRIIKEANGLANDSKSIFGHIKRK